MINFMNSETEQIDHPHEQFYYQKHGLPQMYNGSGNDI